MLRGGNQYRGRAYIRAAASLRTLIEPLHSVIARGAVRDIPGVGEAIANVVTALHETGTHPLLETLRSDAPAGVLELLRVPGLAPDQVMALHRELGIASLDELEAAARSGQLAGSRTFGEAMQRKVLQGIAALGHAAGRRHIHAAAEILADAGQSLRRLMPAVEDVAAAGDLRRGCELVGELALVATRRGKPATITAGGIAVHLTNPRRRGIALLLATGSAAHLDKLRERAAAMGYALDERGLVRGETIISATEPAIYAALGLAYIEPELREGGTEIALASRDMLPALVTDQDIRGILHAHTTASDGADTLEDMAAAVRQRGYGYFGVSDHSQSAHYAGGLKPERIAAQHAAIDRLNEICPPGFRILKGIESDIRPDGSLDYPDEILAGFDFVVASVHGRFRLDEAAQTARIVRAVANPYTTILGHMTGRQLLRRPGYEVDIDAVLAACAEHGVAVEINANPWRLDLDWRWHRRALELGCTMAIDPDAHSVSEIDMVRWGVAVARKGGVPQTRVLNCRDLSDMLEHLAKRRARHRGN